MMDGSRTVALDAAKASNTDGEATAEAGPRTSAAADAGARAELPPAVRPPAGPAFAASSPPPPAPAPARSGRKRLALLVLAALALGGGGWYGWRWWTEARFLEQTDDAYLAADSARISPRIAGQVAEVLVADNQRVRRGDVLVRLDDRDMRVALRSAEADLAAARADLDALDAQVRLQDSTIASADAESQAQEAQLDFAQAEARRYADLRRTGSGTTQRAEQTAAEVRNREANLARARAAAEAARRRLDVLRADREKAQAAVERAQAAVQRAGLNLSYAVIEAPIAGAVGDRTVRPGQSVQPGTRLMDVVPLGDQLYVVANYKETQLARMSRGEEVRVRVDMLPGVELRGRIDSLAPGSGAQFALLPPENATGNFTKIVQRVPVRIALDLRGVPPDVVERLRPGLSVLATTDTRTGPAGEVRTLVER